MCHAKTCKTCGKTTWSGCGQHIAQVKASVPANNWCNGQHTSDEKATARTKTGSSGFLARLVGR